MTPRSCLIIASLAGLTGVMLGAFGSHVLQSQLTEALLKVWHTAVLYQFIHALALTCVALLLIQQPQSRSLKVAAGAFTLGILLFSGSLYILAMTQIGKLGIITPMGGVSFLVGWAALLVAALKWQNATTA